MRRPIILCLSLFVICWCCGIVFLFVKPYLSPEIIRVSSHNYHHNVNQVDEEHPIVKNVQSRAAFFSASIGRKCLCTKRNSRTLAVQQCGGTHAVNELFKFYQGRLFSPQLKLCYVPDMMMFVACSPSITPSITLILRQGRFIQSSNSKCLSISKLNKIILSNRCDTASSLWTLKSRPNPHPLNKNNKLIIYKQHSVITSTKCKAMDKNVNNVNINNVNDVQSSLDIERVIHIAFFIRGTKTATYLLHLLKTIYLPQHMYLLHLDARADEKEHSTLLKHVKKFNNVFMFDHPAFKVHYMDFDLMFLDIRAVLFFLHAAHQDSKTMSFDYFINLADTEFPLVSMTELTSMLHKHWGRNFVDIWCKYDDAPTYKQKRVDDVWFQGKRLMKRARPEGKPVGVDFMFGSFYVCLTYQFLKSLFSFDETGNTNMLELLTYLRNVRVADEVSVHERNQFLTPSWDKYEKYVLRFFFPYLTLYLFFLCLFVSFSSSYTLYLFLCSFARYFLQLPL
jgi:hypothetical protein